MLTSMVRTLPAALLLILILHERFHSSERSLGDHKSPLWALGLAPAKHSQTTRVKRHVIGYMTRINQPPCLSTSLCVFLLIDASDRPARSSSTLGGISGLLNLSDSHRPSWERFWQVFLTAGHSLTDLLHRYLVLCVGLPLL